MVGVGVCGGGDCGCCQSGLEGSQEPWGQWEEARKYLRRSSGPGCSDRGFLGCSGRLMTETTSSLNCQMHHHQYESFHLPPHQHHHRQIPPPQLYCSCRSPCRSPFRFCCSFLHFPVVLVVVHNVWGLYVHCYYYLNHSNVEVMNGNHLWNLQTEQMRQGCPHLGFPLT